MQIDPNKIDPEAAKVVQRLRRFDHAAYFVGGCVRDLLLGGKPKDFDVATSATPNEIRRLFRNCRIIGRRFRLAHIFFGSKIIETSTFRANPRETDEEPGEAPTEAEAADLLIRRDNVFGSAEEDARRRDFTINGLFYDIETGQVIDHVQGMADLEARLVRTIGDPDVRFREDPVRILRAVKFAARCNLSIEPETYRRMMEHSAEIQKCAQARVSEEFYRLLRAGAAKRSMELLLETTLLRLLVPALDDALEADDAEPAIQLEKRRFWAYLGALDRSTQRRESPPSNALILATLLYPKLRDALHADTNSIKDIGQFVSQAIGPAIDQLKASRRDSELARQILLAMRYIFPGTGNGRRRPRFAGREFLDDALRLHEIVSDAETLEADLIGRPLLVDGEAPSPNPEADERLARELETPSEFERRRGRGGRGRRDGGGAAEGAVSGESAEAAMGPGPRPEREPARERPAAAAGRSRNGGHADRTDMAIGLVGVRTPIPDLTGLGSRALSRLPFLGTGAFGGRWHSSD
jgi:poly(A) polymerase